MPKSHKISSQFSSSSGDEDIQTYSCNDLLKIVPEDEMVRLETDVVQTINQQLTRAEDLHVTVPRLLALCQSEAIEMRKSMASMVSTHTGEAYRCLRILKEGRSRVATLRETFTVQGSILSGMQTASCYRQMRQLNTLRTNLRKVIDWTEALKAIHHEDFNEKLEDGKFSEVYERLRKNQAIRLSMSSVNSKHRAVFEPYFLKLDVIITVFMSHVQKVFEDSSMIAILYALRDDGESDEHDTSSIDDDAVRAFNSLSQCIEICAQESADPCLQHTTSGTSDPPLTHDTANRWIRESISKTWVDEIMGEVTDPFSQVDEYLESMKKTEQLLQALEMSLLPLSTKLPFFGLMVSGFHSEIMRVMDLYGDASQEVEAEKLLEAIKFLRWYREILEEDNFAQYVDLGDIDHAIANMMKLAVSGMSRHLVHLSESCAITTCSMPPKQMPGTGQMFTPGPTDLFAILQQSLGSISVDFEPEVAQKLGQACVDGIRAFIVACRKQSDYDYWEDEKSSELKSDDWATSRLHYLYAFSTDLNTIEQNLETIELKFASCWPDDIEQTPFQMLQDDIPDYLAFYVDEIAAHVDRIVAPEWEKMFGLGSVWAQDDANPLSLILATVADFMDEDFATALQESVVKRLNRSLLLLTFSKYLSALIGHFKATSDTKWKTEESVAFAKCLTRDANTLVEFWQDRVTGNRTALVDQGGEAIKIVADLILAASDADTFYTLVHSKILVMFGDCPTFVIRYVAEKRGDIPKAQRESILQIWSDSIASQQRTNDTFRGWKLGQTFLGGIARSLAPEERRRRGFFSSKQPEIEDEQAKKRRLKDEKRKARAHEADEKKAGAKRRTKPPAAAKSTEVEVTSLADLLK